MQRHRYPVMGTVFSFAFGSPVTRAVIAAAEAELDRIDRSFSTYRPDSDVARLAAGRGDLSSCPDELRGVLELCAEASRLTDGYFNAWHSGRLDPTGLVKGWAVARIADLLSAAGSSRHAVNGGGDVLVVADPGRDAPWRVGVSSGSADGLAATISAHRLAVATSGNWERPGEIIDPFTRRPAIALGSVTVAGPDITMADAFATAAVAMGESALAWLSRLPGYAALVVNRSGAVAMTPRMRQLVTTAGPAPIAAT
jgi:thiamine biosynthesis lipoprotein